MSSASVVLALLGGLASFGLPSAPAEACGGTFCDLPTGPTVMPVDQSGENILFWIDDSGGEVHTEAHIQIQYEGDPDRFAWLVPVSAAPEVLVGSQALFENLLDATQPVLTLTSRSEPGCPSGSDFGCAGAFVAFNDGFAGTGFGDEGAESGQDPGPDILERGFAGAFEYVILTGDNATVITDWLDEAGYAQDEDAPPILDEYLQDGFVFVAFKLRGGTGVDEIHPLAIRYPGAEPCIPIRLTRIAATQNMAIRAFFLGQDRVAPQNWPHVALNWTELDWVGDMAGSYLQLVSAAIDEAGGRAFVTEYAGTDAIVSTNDLSDPKWSAAAFAEVDPLDVISVLASQALIGCNPNSDSCEFFHPQVRPLLERYLPAPDGLDPEQYWTCLSCYEGLFDPVAWGAQPGFAAEFEERIVGPGEHALDMLADASTLTRLFTLLSPHEMIEDPLFHGAAGLGTVDNNITATRVFGCGDTPDWIELADGRVVALEGGAYPDLDLPAAERIEQVPAVGPAQVQTDNGDEIDQALAEFNRSRMVGPSPSCSSARPGPEAMFAMFALFGLVWLHRAPWRRA